MRDGWRPRAALRHLAAAGVPAPRAIRRGTASPASAGKLGVAPGEADFQPIATVIADTCGSAALAWLTTVRADSRSRGCPDDETLSAEVDCGQVEIGIINWNCWYRLRARLRTGAT